jgi:hypothetical protein
MFDKFSLKGILPNLNLHSEKDRTRPRKKLQKPPPPPKILDDSNIRDRLNAPSRAKKPVFGLRSTLSLTYENLKGKFGHHREKERCDAGTAPLSLPISNSQSDISQASPTLAFSVYKVILNAPPQAPRYRHMPLSKKDETHHEVICVTEGPVLDRNSSIQEDEVHLVTIAAPLHEVIEVSSIVLEPATATSPPDDIHDATVLHEPVMAPSSLVSEEDEAAFEPDIEVAHRLGLLYSGYRPASKQTTTGKPGVEFFDTADPKQLPPLITNFSFLSHGDNDGCADEDDDTGRLSDQGTFTRGDSPVSSSSSRSSTMSDDEREGAEEDDDGEITQAEWERMAAGYKEVDPGTTQDDEDVEGDEDQEEEEEELTRADWEPLCNLPSSNFTNILAFNLGGDVALEDSDFEYVTQHEGGYNHVRIYKLSHTANAGTYVVKVPCVGTAARWQPQDAHMLRS